MVNWFRGCEIKVLVKALHQVNLILWLAVILVPTEICSLIGWLEAQKEMHDLCLTLVFIQVTALLCCYCLSHSGSQPLTVFSFLREALQKKAKYILSNAFCQIGIC